MMDSTENFKQEVFIIKFPNLFNSLESVLTSSVAASPVFRPLFPFSLPLEYSTSISSPSPQFLLFFPEHLVRTLELFSVSLKVSYDWVFQSLLEIGIPLPKVFEVYNR